MHFCAVADNDPPPRWEAGHTQGQLMCVSFQVTMEVMRALENSSHDWISIFDFHNWCQLYNYA